jgi:hypothetical protein
LLSFTRTETKKSELSARENQNQARGENMQKEQNNEEIEMLDEYDFSGGVRGKYANRIARESNIVVLEPDVAKVFTDSESVNQALRALLPIIEKQAERIQQ